MSPPPSKSAVRNNEIIIKSNGDQYRDFIHYKTVCEALIDTCLEKGSRDNMSAVIVSLPAAVFGEKKISPYWKPGQNTENTGGTPQQGR